VRSVEQVDLDLEKHALDLEQRETLPDLDSGQWLHLADCCVLDAMRDITDEKRYAISVSIAAYCFEQSRRVS
jgi:hypothetical protein